MSRTCLNTESIRKLSGSYVRLVKPYRSRSDCIQGPVKGRSPNCAKPAFCAEPPFVQDAANDGFPPSSPVSPTKTSKAKPEAQVCEPPSCLPLEGHRQRPLSRITRCAEPPCCGPTFFYTVSSSRWHSKLSIAAESRQAMVSSVAPSRVMRQRSP